MIQKFALVILSVVVVVLLFSKPCNENKIRRKNRYSLYMMVDSTECLHNDALVLLNGKEIGMLNAINPNGSKKVLGLRIYDGVKLPDGAFVAYFESMLGDSYLSFTFPEKSTISNYVSPGDTLNWSLISRIGNADTVSAKVVMKLVKEVINEVDSNLNKK
jgi:ABC-type transporter Mla subunit MlaD